MSDSWRPHRLQHSRLPCPSLSPRVCSNSCSLMLSKRLILRYPLLPPSVFSGIKIFSNGSALCIRWPKYWSFSFSITLSNEYLGLISFRIDWLNFFTVQGALKSLLQHHSSKASVFQYSIFFMVQLSLVYH